MYSAQKYLASGLQIIVMLLFVAYHYGKILLSTKKQGREDVSMVHIQSSFKGPALEEVLTFQVHLINRKKLIQKGIFLMEWFSL